MLTDTGPRVTNSPLKAFDPTIVLRWITHSRISPFGWVLILCSLFTLPAIFIRGAHYEEGTTIALARAVFEDGMWPDTYRYGERLSERPPAVAWLLGVLGMLTGSMPVWLARIPTALSLFGGASLIFWFVRQYASAVAALFAAVCFIASPMMLQKTVTAESDIAVSALLFAAFVLFWRGYETGGPSIGRWLAVAGVVAVSGLIKGPQPLGYFFLGVGAFLVLRGRWKNFIFLTGAGVMAAIVVGLWYFSVYQPGDVSSWAEHSRIGPKPIGDWTAGVLRMFFLIAIELLPGLVLFVPLVWMALRRPARDTDLIVALALYASACTFVLILWPGAGARYAMPATFAVATGAGLVFDRFAEQKRALVGAAVSIACLLVCYRLILNWIAMPLVPDKFRQQAILGHQVASVASQSATLLVSTAAVDHNYLSYVPYRIRVVPYEVIEKAQTPVWAIVTPVELQALQKAGVAADAVRHFTAEPAHRWHLVAVQMR
jgi:hypothetical protein